MDRDEALDRIANELASHGVMTERMGGETQMCPVSGITGDGVSELMDALVLQAEVMEVRRRDTRAGREERSDELRRRLYVEVLYGALLTPHLFLAVKGGPERARRGRGC